MVTDGISSFVDDVSETLSSVINMILVSTLETYDKAFPCSYL